jgi:hypothetical protein
MIFKGIAQKYDQTVRRSEDSPFISGDISLGIPEEKRYETGYQEPQNGQNIETEECKNPGQKGSRQ